MGDRGAATGRGRGRTGLTSAGGAGVSVIRDSFVSPEAVALTMEEIFGRQLTDRQLAATIGAQPGMTVRITSATGSSLGLSVNETNWQSPNGVRGTVAMNRTLRVDSQGRRVAENHSFFLSNSLQGQGLGFTVFRNQVNALRRAGFDRIETFAARSSGMNGYITWAKFGYDAPLSRVRDGLGSTLAAAGITRRGGGPVRFMSDLMSTERGRNWWQENGNSWNGTFDLRSGSSSLSVLRAYQRRNARRVSGG